MTEPPRLDPTTTALLVMDFQVGLLARLPDPDTLVNRVGATVSEARAHGSHVGWVRVAFTDADFDAIPAHSVMARQAAPGQREAFHADAPTSSIHPRLEPRPEDVTVRKTRMGAFTTTDLDQQLRRRGVDTLLLAGFSTSGVVLSTVREGLDRDYRILVLADACADPDPETHAFLLETLFPRHATVLGSEDLPALWA